MTKNSAVGGLLNQLKTVLFGNQCCARQCFARPRCIDFKNKKKNGEDIKPNVIGLVNLDIPTIAQPSEDRCPHSEVNAWIESVEKCFWEFCTYFDNQSFMIPWYLELF